MMQEILAITLLVLAATYVSMRLIRIFVPKKKDCGCGGCGCSGKKKVVAELK